ncbi:uncharacterized protein Z519_09716 [Cladophialophora bantiana CBS 173.52]|uniref:Uncharacterized protein n=1 Tax=Cladophialophora bantiana (strain ATCC 10958 / CBS 173.52 / CDC B-1940 / NIH 8579) TaxID=1442370 RepID=A0A0D2HFM7_CLAB1|nr:uncharacterized protein Z519_09716 [Cladophialophora bantiana CBS 173.52]KIW89560.1 hypothetical protein Z519_09716 [Cladophialophora bantiana CBS 173.52]
MFETRGQRWTQGLAALPEPPNVLYFPAGADENITETFYDDTTHKDRDSQWIEYFVAPVVSERVNGAAWGMLVNVSARLAQPQRDLRLLNVTGYGDYRNLTTAWGYVESGPLYECSYGILSAIEESIKSTTPYSSLPNGKDMHEGMLEMVTWQYSNETSAGADPTMLEMTNSSAIVVSEPFQPAGEDSSQCRNPNILSYGISLQVRFLTGRAALSARSRTFANFTRSVPSPFAGGDYSTIPVCENYTWLHDENASQLTDDQKLEMLQCQNAIQQLKLGVQGRGVPLLELLLLTALTCADLRFSGVNNTCINAWYAANPATGGALYLGAGSMQMLALTPERMRLAPLKPVGQVSISMMGPGPQSFADDLNVGRQVHGLLLGVASWKLVLALLVAWAGLLYAVTVWAFGAVWAPELLDGSSGATRGACQASGDEDQKFQYYGPLLGIPTAVEAREAKLVGLHGFASVSLLRRRGGH